MSKDMRSRLAGGDGLEYVSEAGLGPVGALLARARGNDPLKGFDPDAFADGAYKEATRAEAAEHEAASAKPKRRWLFWR